MQHIRILAQDISKRKGSLEKTKWSFLFYIIAILPTIVITKLIAFQHWALTPKGKGLRPKFQVSSLLNNIALIFVFFANPIDIYINVLVYLMPHCSKYYVKLLCQFNLYICAMKSPNAIH